MAWTTKYLSPLQQRPALPADSDHHKGVIVAWNGKGCDVEKHAKQVGEVTRPVPAGWTLDDDTNYATPTAMDYDGAAGGPRAGSSVHGRKWETKAELFLLFLPETVATGATPGHRGEPVSLETIAEETNRYANEDWVQPRIYGEGKRPKLFACPEGADGARHRFKEAGKNWQPVTAMSMLVFFAILIAAAALNVRSIDQLWSDEYSTNCAWIQNSMTKSAFIRHRRFLHFMDNSKIPKRGHAGWDPLGKVKGVV